MSFLRNLALTSLLILLISLGSGQLIQLEIAVMAQDEEEESSISILLKGDDGFDDFVDLTESTTNLSDDDWIDRFEDQTKVFDATSGNGLKGEIFADGTALPFLFTGAREFVVYGLFTIPGEYPVNPSEEKVERGVVVYLTDEQYVIVLIDLESDGDITAFVVLARQGNISPAVPQILLDSAFSAFFILELLPNLPATAPPPLLPVPGPDDELLCSDELDKVRDLNLTLDKEQSIAKTQDSSGEDLYELRFDTPNLLEIESFSNTHRVDATYNEEGHTRFIILANLGTQRIELKDGIKFRLNVAAEEERHCISGTAEFADGQFKVTGELHSN